MVYQETNFGCISILGIRVSFQRFPDPAYIELAEICDNLGLQLVGKINSRRGPSQRLDPTNFLKNLGMTGADLI